MQYFVQLVELLPFILPCESCRNHTLVYIKAHPINRESPRLWLQDFRKYVRENNAQVPSQGNLIGVVVLVVILAVLIMIFKNAFF
jgi:hypothetical protein